MYLFLMRVIPTVPAGWLTFAEGVVYKHYNEPVRVWGLSPTNDQQIAGAIMKLGGSTFLWGLIIYIFFKRFSSGTDDDNSYVRAGRMPLAEVTGHDEEALTYDQVTAAFDRSNAPHSQTSAGSLPAEHTPRDER